MTLEELKERTKSAAEKMFPNEIWIEDSENVFVAGTRYKALSGEISKNEKLKLQKELEQSRYLASKGHVLFLTPEIGKGKHFDGFMDGSYTFDLKRITGSIQKVGTNFSNGAKKAEIIFLEIIQAFSRRSVYKEIKGELIELMSTDTKIKAKKVLIKITGDELYELRISELV